METILLLLTAGFIFGVIVGVLLTLTVLYRTEPRPKAKKYTKPYLPEDFGAF